MKRKKKSVKKSQFMREYYQGHYEDAVWVMMGNNSECKEAEHEYVLKERAFTAVLEEKCPELLGQYADVIDSLLNFQNRILDEAYILGAKDRERSLLPQE